MAAGRLEFSLGGWTALEPEGASVEAVVAQLEAAQRWLSAEFGYRCVTAYVAPRASMPRSCAALLRASGVEMLVLDGAAAPQFEALRAARSAEFLWETSSFAGAESRLFTHVAPRGTPELWELVQRVAQR